MQESDEIRRRLIESLKAENAFYSYDMSKNPPVSDDILIEKTLIYLDLDEIALLFRLFSKRKIKRVWLKYMVPQGEYLWTLNRFIAWYYFDIKRPSTYLRAMETRHFNKLCKD